MLTFWPRTFHPFAVRSYAERAVPELQEILDRANRGASIVVVAHSQGSVLAYAALRALCSDATPAGPGRRYALVTVGSPLRAVPPAPPPVRDLAGNLLPNVNWTHSFDFDDGPQGWTIVNCGGCAPGVAHWVDPALEPVGPFLPDAQPSGSSGLLGDAAAGPDGISA